MCYGRDGKSNPIAALDAVASARGAAGSFWFGHWEVGFPLKAGRWHFGWGSRAALGDGRRVLRRAYDELTPTSDRDCHV